SVDSINNELATIRLVQRGDSIFLNNNRGGAFIPKIDSLAKLTSQLSSISKALINRIDSLVTALSTKTYGRIDSSSLFIADPVIVTKFLDSTFLPTINFDGTKSYINIGSTSLASRLSSSNLTFEFWIKNTLKNNVNQTIFSTGYDLQGQGINVNLNNGKLTFSFSNFNHQISLDYPNDSLWHHVAYTNKEKSVSIVYLDGVEKMRANNTGLNIGSSQRLAIGAAMLGTTPTEFYKGSLRKMRISKGISYSSNFTPSYTYTKADSTIAFWELNDLGTRIKANDSAYNGTLYNGTWLVTDTSIKINNGLVGYYPFNGNANDSSTNRNNGIVNGATLTTDRYGKTNSAYLFKDNFITIPNHKSYEFNNYTISFWAATSSSLKQIPIVKSNYNDATNEQFGFAFNDT
ncbi:MAG: LamG domain-containing protein, partial [Sediminibacterium sp.]